MSEMWKITGTSHTYYNTQEVLLYGWFDQSNLQDVICVGFVLFTLCVYIQKCTVALHCDWYDADRGWRVYSQINLGSKIIKLISLPTTEQCEQAWNTKLSYQLSSLSGQVPINISSTCRGMFILFGGVLEAIWWIWVQCSLNLQCLLSTNSYVQDLLLNVPLCSPACR